MLNVKQILKNARNVVIQTDSASSSHEQNEILLNDLSTGRLTPIVFALKDLGDILWTDNKIFIGKCTTVMTSYIRKKIICGITLNFLLLTCSCIMKSSSVFSKLLCWMLP